MHVEHQLKQAKTVEIGVQLTAVQDSHAQLSIDYEQLQAAHTRLTDKYAAAAQELSGVQQELVQSKLDLDTSRFLRQVRPAYLNHHVKQAMYDHEEVATPQTADLPLLLCRNYRLQKK